MGKKLSNPSIVAILFFGIVACFSWFANQNGTALPTGDSGSMIISSRALHADGEYAWPTYDLTSKGKLETTQFEPNTVWPPACATLIVALQKIGFAEVSAVRIFVAFFAGLTLALVFLLSFKITRLKWLSIFITVSMSLMWNSYYWIIHSFMPESLYISFTILVSLAAMRLLEKLKDGKAKIHHFVALGVLTGLTYHIKSAAPAFILSIVLSLYILNRFKDFKISISQGITFLASIALTALPWFIRNLMIGTIGGSGAASQTPLRDSVFSLLRLFVPRHGSYFENKLTIIFALLLISMLGLLVIISVGKSYHKVFQKSYLQNLLRTTSGKPHKVIPIVYSISFVAVIFFAIYIVPKASHIETRYWMEIYPFAVPVIFGAFIKLSERKKPLVQLITKACMFGILGIVVVSNVLEIKRNSSKQWTLLKSEEAQAQFRSELCSKLKATSVVRYTTNYGNQLFADTGLSYWDVRV